MSAVSAGAGATAPVVAFGEVLFDQFRDRDVLGGAPFNVAWHLHAFGLRPLLISRIGADAAGEALSGALAVRGMRTDGLQHDPDHPTGRVRVVETDAGHRFDVLDDQAYDHIDAAEAARVVAAAAPRLVYFGTLAQRGASRAALARVLDACDATPFLDLNLREPWVHADVVRASLQRAHIVKLNEEELARLAALGLAHGDAPLARLVSLVARFDQMECAVLTRGADGAAVVDRQGEVAQVDAAPVAAIVDTVGAGDGFAAVYALGRLQAWPQPLRLARAAAFAGAICGIRGAIPDGPDFYRPFIRAWQLDAAGEVARA